LNRQQQKKLYASQIKQEQKKREKLCHYFIDKKSKLTALCDNDGHPTRQPKFRKNLGMYMCNHHYKKIGA